jgi:hypothetical protein
MKSPGRVILGTAAILVSHPETVAANQGPGPLSGLFLLSIPPTIVVLTAAGGGYAIRRRLAEGRGFGARVWFRGMGTAVGVVGAFLLLVFWNAADDLLWQLAGNRLSWSVRETLRWIPVPVFGAAGFLRGVTLLVWGMKTRAGGRLPAHLVGARPGRLLAAGALLVAGTLFLAAGMVALSPDDSIPMQRSRFFVREATAELMAAMRREGERTGITRLPPDEPGSDRPDLLLPEREERWPGRSRFEASTDRKHFTILLPPAASAGRPYPFFPYNYIGSHPAYRADESGRIRAIRSHHAEAVCPPDAPVVMQVSEEDVQRAMAELQEKAEARRERQRQ